MALQNDDWSEFRGGATAPAAPAPPPAARGSGVRPRGIPAAPRAPSPPAGFEPDDAGGFRFIPGGPADPTVIRREAEARREPEATRVDPRMEAIRRELQADNVLQAVERARTQANEGWATGNLAGSEVFQRVPVIGQNSADLAATLTGIQGSVITDTLQQLKALSATGASGFGSLTEQEGNRLAASVAALQQTQSRDELLTSLENVERHYRRARALINGQDPRDPAVAAQYGIVEPGQDQETEREPGAIPRAPPGTTVQFAGDTPPAGPTNFTPEQQRLYDAFVQANPRFTADQLRLFSSSRLGGEMSPELAAEIVRARDAGAGIRPGSEGIVEPPDISDVRGEGADQGRLQIENAIASGMPILGPAVAALQGATGPETASAYSRGLADVPTLGLAEEARAAVESIGRGPGAFGRSLGRERAIDRYDERENFLARLGGQLVGGSFLPMSRAPGLGRLALEGGAYGGAYGLGSGEGEGRFTNALVGTGAGALAAPGIELAVRSLRGVRARPTASGGPAPEEIGSALLAEGIPAARPIADPSRRGRMAYLETTRGGHDIVQEGLEETRAGIERRAGSLQGEGNVQTPGGMGETIQRAGRRRIDALRRMGRARYNQAAAAGGETPIQPTEMLAELDGQIAQLSRNENANAGTLDYLRSVRGDLIDDAGNLRPKTVADIRDIRTGLNDEISRRNLMRTRAEAVMERVLSAGRRDLDRDLGAVAPEALRLYREGDQIWSRLHTDRRQVVDKLVGNAENPLSGERVLANVTNMMRNTGDLARFNRVMDMMTPAQRADFRATLIEPIGRRAADEPFSPAIFLANTRAMQPDALRTVFGREGAQSIQNLRLAARGFADASSSLNRSRSGFVTNFKDLVSSVMDLKRTGAGAAGYALAGWPGAVAGAAAGEAIGRFANRWSAEALMNPEVSQWIRRVSQARTESAVRTSIDELRTIATRNPAIAPEVTGLRQFLLSAANDNFAPRAAASPTDREAEQPNPERRQPQPAGGQQ